MVGEYADLEEENFYEQTLPLKGKHIVSQIAGAYLGDVTDVYIDTFSKRMSGIIFTKDLLGIGEKYVIAVDNIEALGEDIVMVRDKNCAVELTEETIPPGKRIEDFRGIKVTTQSGKDLGIIEDIQFRPFTFRIGEIIFTDGKRVIINAADVVMGEDVVLVPEDYAFKVIVKVEEDNLLSRLVNKEKELVHTLTEDVGRWVNRNLQ